MKHIFKVFGCVLMAGGLLATSCTDKFLEEVKRDAPSTDWLSTPEGQASIANSLYMNFNYFFSNESSYCYTNYGTDEFMVAGDASNGMWNDYDARLVLSSSRASTPTPRPSPPSGTSSTSISPRPTR